MSHNGEALVGFHEDALSQAAMGKAQLLLAVVLGLGLAADCSELTILGYILPAAELHLCIGEHRKGWLGTVKQFIRVIYITRLESNVLQVESSRFQGDPQEGPENLDTCKMTKVIIQTHILTFFI